MGKSPIREDGKPIYNATYQVLSTWEPEGEKEAEFGIPNIAGSKWVGRQTKEDGVSWRERDVQTRKQGSKQHSWGEWTSALKNRFI